MSGKPANRNGSSKRKQIKLTCRVGGWGMSKDGKVTIVPWHKLPMMSQLTDAEKRAYYQSVADNPDMPAQVRKNARAKLAEADVATKRRKAG